MNVVSFGGGTNSTAMIIGMYLHEIPIDLILFADTGGEQPHTYEFIGTFNQWLEKHGLPTITPVSYTDKDGKRLTLEEECLRSGTLPSIAYGFKRCSLKHKIGTQEKFCNHCPGCMEEWAAGRRVHKYIGYDAGETRRIQHAAPADEANKKYENHYPLYVWGWDRAECVRVIERAGLPRPGKSSCFFCPSMKKAEIRQLWEEYPDLFQRAIDIEHNAAETLTSVKGLGRKWSWENYYQQVMENLAFEAAQMTFDDLSRILPAGAFAARLAVAMTVRKDGATVDKPKNLYLVKGHGGLALHIWAASGDQAKRVYCREYGIKASDYWCGVRSLTARKLKPEEVKAWEENAPIERATALFIKGMFEITAKAYAERAAEGVTA